jgi:lipopolysaccharide assembly outer membrane protein LptD (OstA)
MDCLAQGINPSEDVPAARNPAISLPDTTLSDSTATSQEEVDTTISYSADDINFDVPTRITTLTGHARIRYKTMTLEAAWITVDWNNDLMIAGGTQDTIYTDSTNTIIDTIVWVGKPVYTDAGDVMTGDHILYNYRTKKGRVLQGETKYLDGYYWGSRIKRVEDQTFFVGSGTFTTCEEDKPHYHFRTKDMKMIVNDKVIARPIILYFGDVPVGIIPYGIFPNKRGRHSGMLIPYYGESASQGRFLKDVGYYFALSDYYDLTTSFDYYERYGFLGRGNFRYKVRYLLDGSIRGSFVRQHFENRKERRWDLAANHSQVIDPWTQLAVNLQLVSDNAYYNETSTNLVDRLNKTIYSDATLTHSWPGTQSSMSVNFHHEQNLETNTFSQTIPQIFYRYSQSRIISPPSVDASSAAGDTEQETKWYHNLYWSYSAQGLNKRQATNTTGDRWRSGARHSLNFNSPQGTLRYLTLTPSIQLTEDWFAEWVEYYWRPSGAPAQWDTVSENREGFRQRLLFSTSLAANTTLYGLFLNPFRVGADFRHVMTPRVTLTYRPDFSERRWGYYGYVRTSDSTVYSWDRFTGNIIGSTPVGEQRTLGLSLDNLFQYKRTTEDQVIRRDLFNLSFSINYNFAAEEFPLSDLSTSFRTSPVSGGGIGPLKSMSLDASFTHSPYQMINGTQIERYVWQDFSLSHPDLFRLKQTDLGMSLRLSGGGTRSAVSSSPEMSGILWQEPMELIQQTPPPVEQTPSSPTGGLAQPSPTIWDALHIPWDLTLSCHYSTNRLSDTRYFWLNGNVEFDLTTNWKIGYTTRVDLLSGDVTMAGLTIYRDLHCWEGRFIWNPPSSGLGQGYFLRISVKSSQLRDVKFEKQLGSGTSLGY